MEVELSGDRHDMTEEEWELLRSVLPTGRRGPVRPQRDVDAVVNDMALHWSGVGMLEAGKGMRRLSPHNSVRRGKARFPGGCETHPTIVAFGW